MILISAPLPLTCLEPVLKYKTVSRCAGRRKGLMASGEIQSLSRAVAILDCFTIENHQLGVREIARQVDLSVSTAGRLLASLNALGLLSQDASTRLYRIGPKVKTYNMVYTAS